MSFLAPKDMQYELAMNACKKTLEDLQTDYVDLCLIHWPGVMNIPAYDPKHSKYRKDTWHALEQMLEDGKNNSNSIFILELNPSCLKMKLFFVGA